MTSEEQRERSRKYTASYRARHPERAKETTKASWEKNKHKYLAKKSATMRRLYERKKSEILKRNEAYRISHLDEIRQKQREYRFKNLEKKRQECREWHRAHKNDPEYKRKHSDRGHRGYEKNKAHILKKHKDWLNRNPGYMAAVRHRRRLVENASKNLALIKAWMKLVKSKRTAVCYYCDRTIPTRGLHFDHIVAISNGGIHDVSNLCVSCASCNLRKQDKPVSAWVRIGQQTLNL